jgi:UDP-N-acetylglucosamine--N-acetylmuramyl-(pentapeptide) pyrophosphoryl-undecaprenol N-acetylglucosamine transferase
MPEGRLRVLIAGGGTGGHVLPALAVACELVAQYDAEVRFMGTARGMETRLVPAAGFPLELVPVGQLNRVSWGTRLRTVVRLPVGLLACLRLLRNFRPHAVLGVGGYASGPAMLAAILTGTPRMAFEPNAVPGMANRWVGRWVQAAAVNFAATSRFFRNATVTGVPVRPEFFSLPAPGPDAPPHLLVFGGSQGARVLNTILPQIAAPLLAGVPGLTILHQCGTGRLQETREAYLRHGAPADRTNNVANSRWEVREFLDDMPQRFAAATLVLCRSGASTVAELTAAAKPSLLVPFPLAADDHQRRNAEMLVQAGAAAMLLQSDLTPQRLLEQLTALLRDPGRLAAMGRRARLLAHPDAALQMARMLQHLRQRP